MAEALAAALNLPVSSLSIARVIPFDEAVLDFLPIHLEEEDRSVVIEYRVKLTQVCCVVRAHPNRGANLCWCCIDNAGNSDA